MDFSEKKDKTFACVVRDDDLLPAPACPPLTRRAEGEVLRSF